MDCYQAFKQFVPITIESLGLRLEGERQMINIYIHVTIITVTCIAVTITMILPKTK